MLYTFRKLRYMKNIGQFWFIEYKLYHLLFWGLLFYLWAAALYNDFNLAFNTLFLSPKGLQYAFIVVIHTLAVYFTLYVLVPKLLKKGKLLEFTLAVVAWIVLVSLIILLSYFLSSKILGQPLEYYHYFADNKSMTNFFTTRALPSAMGATLLGLSIKLTKTHLKDQKRQQALEREKLETELRFLRYQFNPHFLFNTINSIFFLIKKEPDRALESLAKFSELMRYQLYDSNETLTPLAKELQYLENFMALEKLRKSRNLLLTADLDPQGKGSLLIASFVLMTFVENAFKHVSTDKTRKNWITMKLYVTDEDILVFEISNSKSKGEDIFREAVKYGGIGLENVRRRLELIYPDSHCLKIKDLTDVFSVQLQLKLVGYEKAHGRNESEHELEKEVL